MDPQRYGTQCYVFAFVKAIYDCLHARNPKDLADGCAMTP